MSTLHTVEEAADILRVGVRWLADQARADKVPHRRLGRRIRFSAADIDAILTGHARGSLEPNTWGLTPRSASRRRRAS